MHGCGTYQYVPVCTCMYFNVLIYILQGWDGTVPLAIVMYIDGSFVKHKIPVKPIYITICNLNSRVFGKACAWRVLGMIPSLKKERNPGLDRYVAQRTKAESSSCMYHTCCGDGEQVWF
jgi:hypothetical protein